MGKNLFCMQSHSIEKSTITPRHIHKHILYNDVRRAEEESAMIYAILSIDLKKEKPDKVSG